MILKSLEIENFRKFRKPLKIEAFSNGLNIVLEPNETGKSTLLEALRAAFFIRHSAKTELVRSYMPFGDDVAPRVRADFEIKGQLWTLEKQFLRSPFIRLSGDSGRRENDAAEEGLQELLGFERGNNRGTDLETRGPLGMLWVEQGSALSVESPTRMVRDTVRGVLEAEVGAVTGGRRFDGIRATVDAAYGALRTARTRQPRGELAAAESNVRDAKAARLLAEETFRLYEQSLLELENATTRLRILEREIADPESAEQRRKLGEELKIAESAALRLSAAAALHGQAEEVAKGIEIKLERLNAAEKRFKEADLSVSDKQTIRDAAEIASTEAGSAEQGFRKAREIASTEREACESALTDARQRLKVFLQASAAQRAVTARNALIYLEKREKELEAESKAQILDEDLNNIAKLERLVMEARARFEAGTVKIDLELADEVTLHVNGELSNASSIDVFAVTRLAIGQAATIVVRPPAGTSHSIEADFAAADQKLAAALKVHNVASHAAAMARSERAAAATRELKTVQTQMSTACTGDPTIGLAPGADALRAFVTSLGLNQTAGEAPSDDMGKLESNQMATKLEEATAVGRHEDSRKALETAAGAFTVAEASLAAALKEREATSHQLSEVVKQGDLQTLSALQSDAVRDRDVKFMAFDTAREGVKAYDVAAILKRIDNMTRAAAKAGEERLDLHRQIASLETTISREGVSGPAGQLASAQEEENAAISAFEKLNNEADVLETLRIALTDAANEASRTFLAPVTRRAARYVQQLLPGSDLSFNEELGLSSVLRAGVDEPCGDLSRGTQEQLSILTRLAFADLLLEDGAPISVILDDPLVYSDDARLETMTDILQEACTRMQVILLTCRSKAFRHIEAQRIVLR